MPGRNPRLPGHMRVSGQEGEGGPCCGQLLWRVREDMLQQLMVVLSYSRVVQQGLVLHVVLCWMGGAGKG